MHEENFVLKNKEGKRIQATLRVAYGTPIGTMVLLHGLGGWREQYLLVVVAEAVRAQGYHVVTFDAADGAKGPDGDFSRGTTTGYLKDLEEVIDHIRKETWYTAPLVLAAHSQAGLVALRYARNHHNAISKLVLLAPAVSWKIGFPLTLPVGLWWLARNRFFTPGPGPASTKLLLRRSWLLDFITYDANADAKKVQVPTLIISAEKDDTVGSPAVHEKLSDRLKRGSHVTIPHAGHIFYRHEREVADIVTEWIAKD